MVSWCTAAHLHVQSAFALHSQPPSPGAARAACGRAHTALTRAWLGPCTAPHAHSVTCASRPPDLSPGPHGLELLQVSYDFSGSTARLRATKLTGGGQWPAWCAA
jgi:hypothetical protein